MRQTHNDSQLIKYSCYKITLNNILFIALNCDSNKVIDPILRTTISYLTCPKTSIPLYKNLGLH